MVQHLFSSRPTIKKQSILTIQDPLQCFAIEIQSERDDLTRRLRKEIRMLVGTIVFQLRPLIADGYDVEILSSSIADTLEASLQEAPPQSGWTMYCFANTQSTDLADEMRLSLILEKFGSIAVQLAQASARLPKLSPSVLDDLRESLSIWIRPINELLTKSNNTIILWRNQAARLSN